MTSPNNFEISVSNVSANSLTTGNTKAYRNFMNVTITRSLYGYSLGANVGIVFESGSTDQISNGVYVLNTIVDAFSYNVKHTGITIHTGNLSNLVANTTGYCYAAAT